MAKSINCYLFILLLASVLFSQSKSSKEAYLVDEFGVLPECDLGARLDPFAMELLSNLDSRGRIIFYKGKNVLPVDYENQWDWATRFTKSYLKCFR